MFTMQSYILEIAWIEEEKKKNKIENRFGGVTRD